MPGVPSFLCPLLSGLPVSPPHPTQAKHLVEAHNKQLVEQGAGKHFTFDPESKAPMVALGSVKAVLAEIVEAAVVVEEAVEAVAAT